ncbi:uncharacterized protein [Cicer arietinum]|uniref:uncharacterized protein n=1 Tax=Cicer arietinum TaxID=3827 RepID=UPI00032A7DED
MSRGLSLCDSSISLQALDFKRDKEPHMLKRIVNYAISHDVQQLGLRVNGDIALIPPSTFSCQTLTHLKLSIYSRRGNETLFPKSLNLPAFPNRLLISDCTAKGAQTLCISSITLVNLTIYDELEEFYLIELCTPTLCTLAFNGILLISGTQN